jgi:hypothetical protein
VEARGSHYMRSGCSGLNISFIPLMLLERLSPRCSKHLRRPRILPLRTIKSGLILGDQPATFGLLESRKPRHDRSVFWYQSRRRVGANIRESWPVSMINVDRAQRSGRVSPGGGCESNQLQNWQPLQIKSINSDLNCVHDRHTRDEQQVRPPLWKPFSRC